MARWRLTEPHYLNVPGTKWEHTTTDRSSGRPIKKTFDVPLFLHPEDPYDWTHDKKDDGYIVVCHEGKGGPGDITFIGNPTPGMLPLDDEAREISAQFSSKWTPTQGTDDISQSNSFQQKLLNGLIDQMSAVQTASQQPIAGMEKFMEMMMGVMQQNQQILAALVGKSIDTSEFAKQGAALGEAPVPDEEAPLEEAEPTEEEIAKAAEAAAAAEAASHQRALERAKSGRRV